MLRDPAPATPRNRGQLPERIKDQGMSGEDKRSISRILSRLTEVFERAGIETPRLDAEVLLGFCLGKERADLYRDLSLDLDDEQINRVLELTGRRKRREPMAYIRGWREFWSLNFTVTPAVLVPRPETECLVEEVLRLRDSYRGARPRILDIGAGSGAVCIAVASEWPDCDMVATNFRPPLSRWPATNAKKLLGPDRKITFVRGDLLRGCRGGLRHRLLKPALHQRGRIRDTGPRGDALRTARGPRGGARGDRVPPAHCRGCTGPAQARRVAPHGDGRGAAGGSSRRFWKKRRSSTTSAFGPTTPASTGW